MALVPAYGRDYKSAAEVKEAYESGVDFILMDISDSFHGRYCSCRDFPGKVVELRYKKLERVTFHKWDPPPQGLYPRMNEN